MVPLVLTNQRGDQMIGDCCIVISPHTARISQECGDCYDMASANQKPQEVSSDQSEARQHTVPVCWFQSDCLNNKAYASEICMLALLL